MSYKFVSAPEDLDLERIIAEAPANTPFILLDHRDRKTNKPLAWGAFFNLDVLHENIRSKNLLWIYDNADPEFYNIVRDYDIELGQLASELGFLDLYLDTLVTESFAFVAGLGHVPGELQVMLGEIRKDLNPKNTVTEVTLG